MDEIAGDYDAAFDGLHAIAFSEDRAAIRRALRSLMANLYSWRSAHVNLLGKRMYERLASNRADGKIAEAFALWRNVDQHHLDQLVDLRTLPLYPGPGVFPSDYLYPGANLCFVPWEETPERVRTDPDRAQDYRQFLAGLPVLPVADVARSFHRRVDEGDRRIADGAL